MIGRATVRFREVRGHNVFAPDPTETHGFSTNGECRSGLEGYALPAALSGMTHDYAALLQVILDGYALSPHGYHGVVHWARVLENGHAVAQENGADHEVVTLFALFHDARRVNDDYDPGHGMRGGDLAHSLRGSLIHLDDRRFDLLYEACRRHTDGETEADATIQACWDADRLDLGRVGITPVPHLLCTETARRIVPWAHERARRNHVPDALMTQWRWEANPSR